MTTPASVTTHPLRVMVAHNHYQHRGGEDVVVDAECNLLRKHGHEVLLYERHNHEIEASSSGKIGLLRDTLWSRQSAAQVRELFQQFRPDVLHVHNTLPLISPAIYWAAADAGVPVVQTLHNFRLLCPQGLMLREQKVCEDCLGRAPWPAVRHACYRGSTAQSAAVAATVQLHRSLGTWRKKVTRYIALNDFCRDKFVQGGLPAERIRVKPNFCATPPLPAGPRDGFLFVGRLAPEKGVHTLAAAARLLAPGLTIRVAGGGPEREVLADIPAVEPLGSLNQANVYKELGQAQALIVPSVWYENFPMTVVEAFGHGVPVIASRIGALASLVKHQQTGLLFEAGNAQDLADTLQWAANNPEAMAQMGAAARQYFMATLTEDVNIRLLEQIYRDAIQNESPPA